MQLNHVRMGRSQGKDLIVQAMIFAEIRVNNLLDVSNCDHSHISKVNKRWHAISCRSLFQFPESIFLLLWVPITTLVPFELLHSSPNQKYFISSSVFQRSCLGLQFLSLAVFVHQVAEPRKLLHIFQDLLCTLISTFRSLFIPVLCAGNTCIPLSCTCIAAELCFLEPWLGLGK